METLFLGRMEPIQEDISRPTRRNCVSEQSDWSSRPMPSAGGMQCDVLGQVRVVDLVVPEPERLLAAASSRSGSGSLPAAEQLLPRIDRSRALRPGALFKEHPTIGDARISGTALSPCGLEQALEMLRGSAYSCRRRPSRNARSTALDVRAIAAS